MEIKMSLIPGGKSGKVGKIQVRTGDKVNKGDMLAQVETGKGNRPIKASTDGMITKIFCEESDEVISNQVMFELEETVIAEEANDSSISNLTVKDKKVIDTELLVIGGGPGGYVAAIYAAKKGMRVTLVEGERLGGTCLNVGCIPTKALVKSSEICHNAKKAELFGIKIDGQIKPDMKKIMERKDQVKNKLVDGIQFLMKKNEIEVLEGSASFVTEDRVFVEGNKNYEIKAKDIIVATGSKIADINIQGIKLPFVLNSTSALSSIELPKSITIIGGGVIGMEFAFIYRYLGVEVHVIEFMDRLLTMIDKEASKELEEAAKRAGIIIHTSSKVVKLQMAQGNEAVVVYEDASGENILICEKVLVAIGREPNLQNLECEKAGIKLNENKKGIAVDNHMRTNVEHIYAIGDVTNIIQLAHVASHQGMIAVDNILGEEKVMDYKAVPNVIFTSPEIASVGLSEDDCNNAGIDYKIGKFHFTGNGKALTMGEENGFIKLIMEQNTRKIIGGTIIGADASSLISTITLAIANQMTDENITETIFAHPTTSEVIHESALELGIGALHQ